MMDLMPFRRTRRKSDLPSLFFTPSGWMDRMDTLFDDMTAFFGDGGGAREVGGWVPAFDVSETEDSMVVKADLPGVEPGDVDISVMGNVLTIRGERKHEEEKEDECYHRKERHYGSFTRSMSLPSTVEENKIEAKYKDGVLFLTIPKSEAAKPRKIEVKTG